MTVLLVTWSPSAEPALADRLVGAAVEGFGPVARGCRVTRHCPRCGSSEHGRPLLAPHRSGGPLPHVSISRTDDLTVVAVTDAGPVGVDVEVLAGSGRSGIDGRTWVRTESLLKATGQGLSVHPGDVSLSGPQGGVWTFDLDLTLGHLAAVTVVADESPSPVVRRAAPGGRARRATP